MPILTYERPNTARYDSSALLEVDRRSREYAQWIQSSLNRIAGAGLVVDGIIGERTRTAVRSFQSSRGLTADGLVGPITEAAMIASGASPPPGAGTGSGPAPPSTLPFPQVNTLLPASGPGYYGYRSSTNRYGLRETVLAMQRVALRWQVAHPTGPRIAVGDISLRGGGDIAGHSSHDLGVDVDIRPVRNDNFEGPSAGVTYRDSAYSRTLTQELVNLIRANGVLQVRFILFNDPAVRDVQPDDGHDDHLHVRFNAPSAPSREAEADVQIDRASRDYTRWVQTSLNRLMAAGLVADGVTGARTRAAVGAFQSRHGLPADGAIDERTEAALIAAGATKPPATPLSPLSSRPYPGVNTPLPRVGPGFYSRKPTATQYGLPETIQALQRVGERWHTANSPRPRIAIGDISVRGGGDISGHVSHERGVDVDIWLARNDGREEYVTYKDAAYSRPLTRALVNLIRANGVLRVQYVFFSDPELIKEGLVKHWPGHDDHLHVRFYPPPAGAREADGPSIPSIIKRESDPPRSTLYLNIPLGGEAPARAETGVFVPKDFKPTPSVDLIVYLHGFKRYGPSISMSGYWDKRRFPQHALREATNQGGKNVILVAPTLGPRSQAGRLVSAGGFDQYVDRVLTAIGQQVYGGSGPPPQLGTLIVASHSGGGLPMRQAVLGSRKYATRIRECWGFDCMYGGASEARQWAQWAASQSTRNLFVYYTDTGGTRANSTGLKELGIPNVHVERTAAPHDRVQISHWLTRLSAASFLATR